MPWDRFTNEARSYAPRGSMTKDGHISFTKGAKRRFDMGRFSFCALYYDHATRRVGVELTNDESTQGVRRMRFKDGGVQVSAKNFIDYYGIGSKETRVFEVSRDEASGFLVLELAKGIPRGASGRRGDES